MSTHRSVTKQSKINLTQLNINIKTVSVVTALTIAINISLFPTDWYNFTIYDLYEVRVIINRYGQVSLTSVSVVTTEVTRITPVLAKDDSYRNVITGNCQWNIVMLNNREDVVWIIGQIESRKSICKIMMSNICVMSEFWILNTKCLGYMRSQ